MCMGKWFDRLDENPNRYRISYAKQMDMIEILPNKGFNARQMNIMKIQASIGCRC